MNPPKHQLFRWMYHNKLVWVKGRWYLGILVCEDFFSFLFLCFKKKPKYSLTGNQVQLIQGSPSKAHLSNFMPHWDDTSCFLQGDSLLHNITQQTDATGHAKLTCLNSGNSEQNVALAETCIVKKGGFFHITCYCLIYYNLSMMELANFSGAIGLDIKELLQKKKSYNSYFPQPSQAVYNFVVGQERKYVHLAF